MTMSDLFVNADGKLCVQNAKGKAYEVLGFNNDGSLKLRDL